MKRSKRRRARQLEREVEACLRVEKFSEFGGKGLTMSIVLKTGLPGR